MFSQENTQHSNMTEQCTDDESDLKYLISQKEQILSNMESEKQKQHNLKEFMQQQQKSLQEQLKFCHELKKKNEIMKEKREKEFKEYDELVKILMSTNEVMNNNIKIFHSLRDSMQLSINYQQESNDLKQNVLKNFDKMKLKIYEKGQEYVKKLNYLSELLTNCKIEHLNNSQYYDTIYYNNKQEILKYKDNITNIQSQIINSEERANKIIDEINILKDNNDLNNEYSELVTKIKEFNESKENEESEYNRKLFNLGAEQAKLNESYLTMKKEFEDLQKGIDHKNEFLYSLNHQKKTGYEIYSNLITNCDEKDKEINNLKEIQKKNLEDHNNKIDKLNKEIKELQENNNLYEEENEIVEQKFSDLNNEENKVNAELDDLKISLIDQENVLKKDLQLLEEFHLKFKAEIAELEKILQEEKQNEITVEEEEQELKAQIEEINSKYEEMNLRSDAATAEAETEEITINLNLDQIKSAIEEEKCEIEKLKENKTQNKTTGEAKLKKVDNIFEEKMKELSSKYKEMKNKFNERNQNDEQLKSEELKKIKDSKRTLELQLSEYKVSTQNLQNEMDLKIKEFENLTQELKEINEKNTIVLSDSKENQSFKRPKYDFKIPKCKIPPSKYSSTSDSSAEDLSLTKRRKIALKRRSEKKSLPSQRSTEPQSSQKSIDDIFAHLKVGAEGRPTRKRSNKKPVF